MNRTELLTYLCSFLYFFLRWIIVDHTGSLLELIQDVLPPPPPPKWRCNILA